MPTIKIIGLTGEPGAGKDIVSNYLVAKHGAINYRFSSILKSILDCLYLPQNRPNLSNLAVALRHKFGNAILADVLKRSILNDHPGLVVINGIRYIEEFQAFKNLTTEKNESAHISFSLWYITTDPEVRYARLKTRGEKDNETNLSWDEFVKENQLETEMWIKTIAKEANFIIRNDFALEAIYAQIDKNMKKLL